MEAARSDILLARHQTREMGIRIEHAVTVLVVYTKSKLEPFFHVYKLTINIPVVYIVRYKVDSPPSKPLCTAPYKQQVHWLFYVPAMHI